MQVLLTLFQFHLFRPLGEYAYIYVGNEQIKKTIICFQYVTYQSSVFTIKCDYDINKLSTCFLFAF